MFVCLFVWVKPENLYFAPCVWREVITPGNGCRRNQAQKLSFTQDSLAFSTKTARRTLQDHVQDRHCGADLIRHGPRVRTLWRRFNQTRTTCINRSLTLYKLTGWLASLDLRKPYTKRILNHRNNHPLRLNIML